MKPNSSQGGDSQVSHANQQNAAADLIRMQIDSMYDSSQAESSAAPAQSPQPQPQAQQQQSQQQVSADSPFNRTYASDTPKQTEQWKQYHSAWQNYYQKYYEQYYTQQVGQQKSSYFSNQPEEVDRDDVSVSKNEALSDLRQQLLGRVQKSAKKIRKSRHFVPIFAALAVVLVFTFLQYNRVIFASVNAYVSPGAINPQNIIIDPLGGTEVSEESKLIIPKINVDVPVIYDIGYDHKSQMEAMELGVAHFGIPGANSRPGEIGNTVISGHSSNDIFDAGDYKFVFAQLDKLERGDTIYANYKGTRYTYSITKTEVVKPSEVNKLIYKTDKPILTLITCTPLGTALNRLLVTAEQISPDPAEASKAPAGSGESGTGETAIPGNSPTFLERLFG